MFYTLFSNDQGRLLDDPSTAMLGQSGLQWVEPEENEMMPLPKGASLIKLPEHLPVGLNGKGEIKLIEQVPGGGKNISAVAALLPQGFTRTLLPASVSRNSSPLPVFGYAAVAYKDDQIYVAAIQSDEHRRWHPSYYNTSRLPEKIKKMINKYPQNRILRQLSRCSLEYGCYTAQNIFYGRWEGGIPTMNSCNANCLGCISESHLPVDSPQNRLNFHPSVQEIAEIGREHLKNDEAIISFGQGCEGEPALNGVNLSRAIERIRQQTEAGTINVNTNAGYTEGIKMMCEAGLDSIRITIFSCMEDSYQKYHQPRNYSLSDVIKSLETARSHGLQISLNLLVFPGFTDREEEIEGLLKFIHHHPVDMIQLRNLNIDPAVLLEHIGGSSSGVGMVNFVNILTEEVPQVRLGSYTHPVIHR